jgi:hypothetical protein
MISVKRTGARVLAMAALAVLAVASKAFADCPELEQLQHAYFDVTQQVKKPMPLSPLPPSKERCEEYRSLVEATKAWVEYARQHDESCRLSSLLPMMEREYIRAVDDRDNLCAGRPARRVFVFPADRHFLREKLR